MQESFDRFLDSEKLRLKDLLDPLSRVFACLSHMWISLAVVAVVFALRGITCYIAAEAFAGRCARPECWQLAR